MTLSPQQQAELATREARRKFIGGSDIAALLSIAPETWKRNSPLTLYLDKVEPPKEVERGNVREKRRGHRWESVVAEMLVEELESRGHKVEIVAHNRRYIDPDYDFMACELDFEIRLDGEQDITNVELKTVHPFKAQEWGESDTDGTPVWYTAQAMYQLGVTRRKRCIVAPLFGADYIRTYFVDAAPDLIQSIRTTAQHFWVEHVVPKVPPLPGSLIDVKALWPTSERPTIELSHDIEFVDAIAELRDLEFKWKTTEDRWNELEFLCKNKMGDHAEATIGGFPVCTWRSNVQHMIDVTRLRAEQPTVAAAYEREIQVRKFLMKKLKAAGKGKKK